MPQMYLLTVYFFKKYSLTNHRALLSILVDTYVLKGFVGSGSIEA